MGAEKSFVTPSGKALARPAYLVLCFLSSLGRSLGFLYLLFLLLRLGLCVRALSGLHVTFRSFVACLVAAFPALLGVVVRALACFLSSLWVFARLSFFLLPAAAAWLLRACSPFRFSLLV